MLLNLALGPSHALWRKVRTRNGRTESGRLTLRIFTMRSMCNLNATDIHNERIL